MTFKSIFFRYFPLKNLNYGKSLCLSFSFSNYIKYSKILYTGVWILAHFLTIFHFFEINKKVEPSSEFNFFLLINNNVFVFKERYSLIWFMEKCKGCLISWISFIWKILAHFPIPDGGPMFLSSMWWKFNYLTYATILKTVDSFHIVQEIKVSYVII